MHNTWERLHNTMAVLAAAPEPLQNRLGMALIYLAPLKAVDFPTEKHGELFEEIVREIAEAELKHDDNGAPIRLLSDERASIIAYKIFELYDDIACSYCSCSESFLDARLTDIEAFERRASLGRS